MPGDGESRPVRKIDDATDATPPEGTLARRWLAAKRWLLLDANRDLVTAGMLAASFATFVLVGRYGPVSTESFVTTGVSPGSVLVELMKAIVSVVVIVLSINQLVLSPGLGPVGEQRERYEQSVELRERVESETGVRVSPSSASAFLEVLLDEIADAMGRLEDRVDEHDVGGDEAEELVRRTSELTRDVESEGAVVRELMEAGDFGEFDVVSASLRFAITEKVRSLRELHRMAGDPPPSAVDEAFDDVEDLFEFFTVAREYMKTVYLREEYIGLSQALLYVALPSVVVTYVSAQLYAPDAFPGEFLGFDAQLLFVSAAVTIALTPFALLLSYVFRLAILSRSTLFVGPFDARPTESERETNREHGR